MAAAFDAFRRNCVYSLRQMRRKPGFTAAVVVTLGLAIGGTTTIFSFVNALLLRPFPFRDPDQLVEIASLRGGQDGKISMREILDIKEQVTSIESIAARTGSEGGYNFSGNGRPEEWKTVLTTGNLFDVLGVPLARGSKWPDHSDRERDYRVVLNYGVWKNKFGGLGVVGNSITLDHASGYHIDGVAGRNFDYPAGIQIYRSLGGFALYDRRDYRNVIAVARIKRPFGIRRLQSELDAVSKRLSDRFPATNAGLAFEARSMRSIYSGDVKPYLVLLMGAVAFVLLIACGNVVNLLLSRGLSRDREIAVRFAIGASRGSVLAQLLTESLALALLSSCLGLLLAYWWMHVLRSQIGIEMPSWIVVDLDSRVLLVALTASLLAGLLSALAPAFHVIRRSLTATLREGGRTSSSGRAAGRLRSTMVVAEIALAVVLLSGAGLLIRSFLSLQSQSKGFDTSDVSTFRVALGWKRYISQELEARYYEQLQAKLKAVAGIQEVGFVSSPPLSRLERNPNTVAAEGQPLDEIRRNPYVNHLSVSENYFSLMRIPLRGGRFFEPFDNTRTELIAIISDRLAKRLWPRENPVGRRLRYNPLSSSPGKWHKVIGIAGSVQHDQLGGELSMDMYVPYRQEASANQFILCKTRMNPRDFEAAAEKAAWNIDPEQSVFDFASYDKRIADSIWQLGLSRLLLVLFGIVALVLAAIGIYGVMSYIVHQRTREMAVRLALGATPLQVRSLVVGSGMVLGGAGLAIGLLGAFSLGRGLRAAFKAVEGMDPLSVSISLSLLTVVIFLACAIPAWRASRIDPLEALREE